MGTQCLAQTIDGDWNGIIGATTGKGGAYYDCQVGTRLVTQLTSIVCSKSSGDFLNMLDVRWSVVTMTHELAKFLIVL
jgi:hypothetical protein